MKVHTSIKIVVESQLEGVFGYATKKITESYFEMVTQEHLYNQVKMLIDDSRHELMKAWLEKKGYK